MCAHCTTCQTVNTRFGNNVFQALKCINVRLDIYFLYFARRYNYYCYNVSYLLVANYQDSCSRNLCTYVEYALISEATPSFWHCCCRCRCLHRRRCRRHFCMVVSLRLEYLSLHCWSVERDSCTPPIDSQLPVLGWLAQSSLPLFFAAASSSIPIHFERRNDK